MIKRWSGLLVFLISPSVPGQPPRGSDAAGDPLTPGAVLRIGSARWRTTAGKFPRSVLSPDGTFLFVRDGDAGIRILDLKTGLSRRGFGHNQQNLGPQAISQDGKRLASEEVHRDAKYFAIIWDIASGKQIQTLELGNDGIGVATFSRDGKKLIVGGRPNNSCVRIFDIASGALEVSTPMKGISLVYPGPDGKTLIAASGTQIRIMNIANGTTIRTIPTRGKAETRAGISRDAGTIALVGPHGREGTHALRLIDVGTGKESKLVHGFPGGWRQPALSPDARYLAVSDHGSVYIWDFAGEKETRLQAPGPTELHFTPDSRRLIAVGGVVQIWDLEHGTELHPTAPPSVPAHQLVFTSNGKTLATASPWYRNTIELFDTASGRLQGVMKVGFGGPELDCASSNRLIWRRFGGIQIWDIDSRKIVTELKMPESGRLYYSGIYIAPDGRTASAAAVDWSFSAEDGPPVHVLRWDMAKGILGADPKRVGSSYREPRLTPDGASVLVVDGTGLALLDAVTGKQRIRLQANLVPRPLLCGTTPGGIHGSFSPNGQTLAMSDMIAAEPPEPGPAQGAARGYFAIFDLASGKEMWRFAPEMDYSLLCAFSPDSKRLATADNFRVRIWSVSTGKRLWESPTLDSQVTALAFSATGSRLATALRDTTILIWDVSSKK